MFFPGPVADVGRIGVPRPAPAAAAAEIGTAAAATDLPQLAAALSGLERRVERLDDEAEIVRLQHQYGYDLDRHDWDAVTALFSEQGTFEPGLRGVYVGRASIRRALEQLGDARAAGSVDDHILFQTYVTVAADGRTAKARVDELGLHGTPGVRCMSRAAARASIAAAGSKAKRATAIRAGNCRSFARSTFGPLR